jgi:hypothetical protein
MVWTRRRLRTWSALCAALLFYAAIPHSHGGQHGSQHDGMRVANGVLVADDAHESHSPSLALDAHPCALCRDKSTHALGAVHPEPLRLEVAERSPCAPDVFARRPELLLAERHPARAPPRA